MPEYGSLAQHLDALDSAVGAVGVQTYTASHVLQLFDAGCNVEMNSASAIAATIPANASVSFPLGTTIAIIALGAGAVTIVPAAGVILNGNSGSKALAAQYAGASIYQRAADDWIIVGNLA